MNLRIAILLIALPLSASAQAAVEAALGASRAATTTAPAQGLGKAISGAYDKLGRALQGPENDKSTGRSSAGSPAVRPTRAAAVKSLPVPSEPKPEVTYEHPSGIQEGMDTRDVLTRFGPPSLKLTSGSEETLCYAAKDGVTLDVTVRNGKVTAVQQTGGSTRGSVVTLK